MNAPPILIGGCGRSGTTLLLSVLSAHPEVFAIPRETEAFCPGAYSARMDLEAPFEEGRVDRVLEGVAQPDRFRFWCEKTPKNILFIRRILARFGGGCRFLNVVRDGRDVVTSFHPNRTPGRFWVRPERWIGDVSAGKPFDHHPQVKVVRYEDLVADPRGVIEKICGFLGLEPVPEILDWPRHATVRRHLAWSGYVEPIHPRSVGRWRLLQHTAAVQDLVSRADAVQLLRHYGYLADADQATTAQVEGIGHE